MCEGRGEFYTNLMSESLEHKSVTKLTKVANFFLKIDADYSSKTLESTCWFTQCHISELCNLQQKLVWTRWLAERFSSCAILCPLLLKLSAPSRSVMKHAIRSLQNGVRNWKEKKEEYFPFCEQRRVEHKCTFLGQWTGLFLLQIRRVEREKISEKGNEQARWNSEGTDWLIEWLSRWTRWDLYEFTVVNTWRNVRLKGSLF